MFCRYEDETVKNMQAITNILKSLVLSVEDYGNNGGSHIPVFPGETKSPTELSETEKNYLNYFLSKKVIDDINEKLAIFFAETDGIEDSKYQVKDIEDIKKHYEAEVE